MTNPSESTPAEAPEPLAPPIVEQEPSTKDLNLSQRDRIDAHMAKIKAKRAADAAADPGVTPKKALDPAHSAPQDASEPTVSGGRSPAELARDALGKSGLKPADLEGIPEDRLIAMGRAVQQTQAAAQTDRQKLAEERNALAAKLNEVAPTGGEEVPAASEGQADQDQELRDTLGREFTDEEAAVLAEAFTKATAPAAQATPVDQGAITAERMQAVDNEVARARQLVVTVDGHADLSQDGPEWTKVVKDADALLLIPNRYVGNPDPIAQAFRDAVALNGHASTQATRPADMTVPARGSNSNKANLPQDQRIARFLRMRAQGASQQQISRDVYGRNT